MSAQLANITKLSPLVTRVLGCNPGKFTLQGTNTYLIGSGRRRILLDTGDGKPEYTQLLSNYLRDMDIEISDILLSHWHPDHIDGVDEIMGVVCSPQAQKPTIHKFPDFRDNFDWTIQPIADKQTFVTEDGSATLVGYHTPGHADDHIVFFLKEECALFSADNVLGEGSTVFNDLGRYMRSLSQMKSLPGLRRLYPGHGPIIEDGVGGIQGYMDHRQERENQIVQMLQSSQNDQLTTSDIVDKMYKELPPNVRGAAERGIYLHLKKLVDENKVIRDNKSFQINLEAKL